MKTFQDYQDIIKEKRKKTPFMQFLMEIPSWSPLALYKNEGLISRYPDTPRKPKWMTTQEFDEIRDSLCEYGFSYDFEKSFFENFQTLFHSVPLPPTIRHSAWENTEFSDVTLSSSHCYLSNIVILDCRNVCYSFQVINNCADVYNSFHVFDHSSVVYFSSIVSESSFIFYSKGVINSQNIWFSTNIQWCHDCIWCRDLENSSYCINNIEYSPEEYAQRKAEILENKLAFIDSFQSIRDKGVNRASHTVSGKHIVSSENIESWFVALRSNKGRNLVCVGICEDFYDVFDGGTESKDFYGVCGGGTYSNNVYCSSQIANSYAVYYSFYCNNVNHCIGCIGLQNNSYCIFNVQYSKEEWEELAIKIFAQMDEQGILGNFFPGELSPFYFNDTAASMLGKFSKQEAVAAGYLWRDDKLKIDIPEDADIISVDDLDMYQWYDESGKWCISGDILKKVIQDAEWNCYKVMPMEYEFLVKYSLPIPKMHWLERIHLHFSMLIEDAES